MIARNNPAIAATLLSVLLVSVTLGADFDIVVNERAIVQRCVMDKAARNIAVGMPGGFNFSFDPVRGRLAYVWFGDFLDFQPEVTARGGRKVEILGSKRMVGTAAIPLRIGDSQKVPESIQFDGYRKEPATGIPTFLFRVDGVNVEQRVLSFGHDQVTIELSFPDASEPETQDSIRYYHMDSSAVQTVELSERLTMQDGIIEIPADQSWAQIQLKLKPSKEKFVRKEPSTSGPLLYALHCNSCHTLDGKKKIGPSFADLWTSKRNVTRDGVSSEIQVDEAYIRESILEPQAAVVQGYEQANKMVDIRKTLNEKQIDALVQFLLDLKP